MSFNKVIVMGNLTRDIELRYTQGGTAVTEVGLAVNDRIKRNNEWVDETTFIDVTMWGRTAEVASEYLGKGSIILVEGRLKQDRWDDADGNKRSRHGVVCEKMQMVGNKNDSGGGQTANAVSSSPVEAETNDDIPF